MKATTPVDFTNPENLEKELAAAAEAKGTPATPGEKKPAKPKVIKVSYVADKDYAAGETISFDYEIPASLGTRGQVVGIALNDMNDDQLKIEYRNANSVYYKTKKAGRDASKSGERLEAVKAVMADRGINTSTRAATPVTAATVADMIKTGKLSVEDIQALLEAAEEGATVDLTNAEIEV